MPSNSKSSSKTFTVYMYEQEKHYLEWLVLQREDIETGGDLFGLWRSCNTAVVQLILGPGKYCTRTKTSFYQDINYLSTMGGELTSSHGLCNIGEWHSHHRIHLPSPSQGDQNTVWNHMKSVSGGRFLVFIATITGPSSNPNVNIGCFMFCTETMTMSEGSLESLHGGSPIRGQFDNVSSKTGPEKGVDWISFLEAVRQNALTYNKKNSAENKDSSVEETNQNEPAVPHTKERRRDKTVATKEPTCKTKLKSSNAISTYGSTQSNQNKSKRDASKSPKKKPSKKHSELSRSTRGDVITTQPEDERNRRLQDVVSPYPHSPDTNSKSRKTSIFDCCSGYRYRNLDEE